MPVDIIVPPLSQTMESLTLIEWFKKPGETVEKGEMLFSVETDKAALEVESPASGTLFKVFAEAQDEVKVRSVIGVILLSDEDPSQVETKFKGADAIADKPPADTQASVKKKQPAAPTAGGRTFSSPRARLFADTHSLDLESLTITPSGPRGMIVERDVQAALEAQGTIATDGAFEVIPQNTMRKVIAKRMLHSHLTNAPVSYMVECDATDLVALREQIIKKKSKDTYRPTFTDLFIKITCQVLKAHPLLNATFNDNQLKVFKHAHIALAVDTPRGLIVPVMRGADKMTLKDIYTNRKVVVERALTGKSQPEELTGGTFTISNLGALGIDFFTPVINPPQVAILAIGRIRQVPTVRDGQVQIREMVSIGATCDHRVIDGAPAARFLRGICDFVERVGQPDYQAQVL